ncbi:hypothetical protein LTR53_001432 [Teratosphaeriaceae sp. CCFEE 6253]|nr:hypothetical protein LTR53_001432 [Teratosphaeriaceae sp. CCFEE 6253]
MGAGSPANNNTNLCLQACDGFEGCVGIFMSPSSCALAVGTFAGTVQRPGYDAYVRVDASIATTISPTSTSSTLSDASSVSTSYFQPTKVPSPGSNLTTPVPSSNCTAETMACPACDGKVVVDDNGRSYKMFCDNEVYADGDYNVQRWTSPLGCLAECDSFSWCKGSTFWPQGNCQLAKGENVFPQEKLGYTAFLPLPNKTATAVAAPTAPSAYPTNTGYSAISAPPSTFSTVISAPQASTTSLCNPDIASCPACDGKNVTDWLNQPYTISCHEVPICGLVIDRANHTLQFECLEYCDADPVCFAMTWESGCCELCQETLEGKAMQLVAGRADVVYYYPLTPGVVASRKRSATTSSTRRPSSTLATTHSSAVSTHHGVSITGTVTSLPVAAAPTSVQAQASASVTIGLELSVSISASTSSRKASGVKITGTVTVLSAAASATSLATSITSSASFVPPLTDGVVSFATPGMTGS